MNILLRQDGNRRIFQDAKIQEAIDDALSHVSEDKPVAVVAHATPFGQRLSVAARIGDDWTIMVAGYRQVTPADTYYGAAGKVVWTP
jgi:hypothetical protein